MQGEHNVPPPRGFIRPKKPGATRVNKTRISDYLPLQRPALFINTYEVKRVYFIKSLGVMLDKRLTWKKRIQLIES